MKEFVAVTKVLGFVAILTLVSPQRQKKSNYNIVVRYFRGIVFRVNIFEFMLRKDFDEKALVDSKLFLNFQKEIVDTFFTLQYEMKLEIHRFLFLLIRQKLNPTFSKLIGSPSLKVAIILSLAL